MNPREAIWLAHQRRRWMLPDPSRWLQPDQSKWMRPEAAWQPSPGLHERKYSPDQPRVPAGSAEGGQWTDAGGGGGAGTSGGGDRTSAGRSNAQLQEERPNTGVVVAQRETGILLGQAIIHPSNGGGKNCFYKFSYGIVAWRMTSLNMACPPMLEPSAANHSPLFR